MLPQNRNFFLICLFLTLLTKHSIPSTECFFIKNFSAATRSEPRHSLSSCTKRAVFEKLGVKLKLKSNFKDVMINVLSLSKHWIIVW